MSDRKGEAGEERKEEGQLVITGWVVLLLFVTDWDGGMGKEGEILTLMDGCDSCGAGGWAEHSLPCLQRSSNFTAHYFLFHRQTTTQKKCECWRHATSRINARFIN